MASMKRPLPDIVRKFSRLLNPATIKDIEKGKGPFSLICHTGRKSGKAYRTPVDAAYLGGHVLITLPYGRRSDWLRNVLAKGGCEIMHQNQTFTASDPAILDVDEARPLLPPGKEGFLQTAEYLKMSIQPESTSAG